MTYKTHYLGGLLAGLIASNNIEDTTTKGLVVGLSIVTSLIPDLDIPNSKLGRKAGVVSKGINKAFGHRGFFHSPILYLVLAYLLQGKVSHFILLGCLSGVFSHLVLDMFNSTGVPLFYPISKSKISVAKIKTRSSSETIFSVILVGLIVYVALKYHLTTSNVVLQTSIRIKGFEGFNIPKFTEIKRFIIDIITKF